MALVEARAGQSSGRFLEAIAAFALIAAPTGILFLLVLLPACVSALHTIFVTGDGGPHLSLAKFAAFFADDYSRSNLIYTIGLTLASSATAIVLAVTIAVYLRFGNGRIAALVQMLALFPLFVPAIIVSFAMIRFLGPHGALDIVLRQFGFAGFTTPYLTPVGPYIAFVWESLPFPVLVVTAGFAQVSDEAIAAARDLGAGRLRILAEILLPQAKRSILIGFALIFLLTFGSFTISYLLGPPVPEMMSVFMLRTFGDLGRADEAEVQAVVAFLVCVVVGLIYVRLIAEDER